MNAVVNIGRHIVPLWLVGVILISGITAGVVGYYLWDSIMIDLEVEEPLEILSYPDELNLFPGETEEFNVTIMNRASVEYTVGLEFFLDNETYQNDYVRFGDETYTVASGQQNLTAWVSVQSTAPPTTASLIIDFKRTAYPMGLVGYWKFDEGSGTTVHDSSSYGNDGTLSDGPSWVDGKSGKALSFDGVNDYVEVPHSVSLNIVDEMTVMAWVKPLYTSYTEASTRVIVGKHGGWHNRGWSIGARELDFRNIRFHWQAGTDNYLDTVTNPLSTNVWTHVVGVANGTHIMIYVDGELSAMKANAESVDYSYPVEMGRNGVYEGSFFNGIIDEVRIYNRALTAQEILEHYTSLQP